ncbi:MAG: 6-carboxytetrahydropterin synthase [Pseudomonadota bacterium]|nr:6-carboxytetrahydropterin synthase [Pseudomonadota bacterium]
MHQIKTKLAEISAAHRLGKNYVGKCQNLHGHNYVINLTFSCTSLDQYDFVIDFGDIKQHCNNWAKTHWDHSIIISSADTTLIEFAKRENQKHYIIPNGENTTVEILCKHLYEQLTHVALPHLNLRDNVVLTEVEIWETNSSCARYNPSF